MIQTRTLQSAPQSFHTVLSLPPKVIFFIWKNTAAVSGQVQTSG